MVLRKVYFLGQFKLRCLPRYEVVKKRSVCHGAFTGASWRYAKEPEGSRSSKLEVSFLRPRTSLKQSFFWRKEEIPDMINCSEQIWTSLMMQ